MIVSEGSDPIILSLRDRAKTWRGLEKEILDVRREDVRTVKGGDTVIISEESGCRERNNCVSQPRCIKKSEIGIWKKA